MEAAKLEEFTVVEGFWDNPQEAQEILQKLNGFKEKIKNFEELFNQYEDLYDLWQLAYEEEDESLEKDISKGLPKLEKATDEMELDLMLKGPYDRNSAIIALHAGAGGLDAQDWVEMLIRMYTRWAEKKNYKVDIIDILPSDEAGIKSATLSISGENAYGYLHAEKGVHRLVRLSPFDTSGKRHTSFASVDVLPEVDDDSKVNIDPTDLKIDTFRASGAGGQHVNKTDSAVRFTHLPTGIVVQCQSERSQHSNRDKAMKLLQAKLVDLKLKEQEAELVALRGEQQEIGWGSQIRSYVFHPYSLVKDHRTNVEVGNVEAVMDGMLDPFISAYLKDKVKSK